MRFDPDRPHRRSIRLPGYDYTQAGLYWVTIVAQDRACLFGEIVNDETHPNEAGLVMESWWGNITRRFPTVDIDAYVVMPNHFHGIVILGSREPDPTIEVIDPGRPLCLPASQILRLNTSTIALGCDAMVQINNDGGLPTRRQPVRLASVQ
jgi:hypothetical protein